MEKIFVDLGRESYTIAIEPHSWSGFGKKIRALSRGDKTAVITDRTVDGLYGDNTAGAVKRFQLANSLAADGIVGRDTWHRLLGV